MASGAHGVPEIVSAIQSASINRHPDPHRDINPSTAASQRETVVVGSSPTVSDVEEDEIPISVLHPPPRKRSLPPLPDLRFEQSYLRSIEHANGWGAVAYITIRDQVLLPLAQGVLWTLILAAWRYWNQASRFSGTSIGARIRRWWWGVNNWKIPGEQPRASRRPGLFREVEEFNTSKFANIGSD